MGDRIAITTWPRHQNLFYLVTGSGVSFDVKALGNAAVGLARKPGNKVDYWIGIGDNNNNRCWIKKDEDHSKSVQTQNLLTAENYTSFWLQWNAGTIRLGRSGEQKPIVTYTNKMPDLKYITFSVLNQHNPVHWRFDLPPIRPKPQLGKRISGGKLIWVEAGNQLPDGALIGGFENEALYIIRAPHRGSLTPGKFMPSEGGGYISWGGDAHGKGEFEVLCGFDCSWVSTCGNRIPDGAVVGGYSENQSQERLYVGRAVHNGHIIPGKVQTSFDVCFIPFEGREIGKKKFEILVEPNEVRSVNDTYNSEMNIDSASETDQEDFIWHVDDDEDELYGRDGNDEMNEIIMF